MPTLREIENERQELLKDINAKLDLALNILEALDERKGSTKAKKASGTGQKQAKRD